MDEKDDTLLKDEGLNYTTVGYLTIACRGKVEMQEDGVRLILAEDPRATFDCTVFMAKGQIMISDTGLAKINKMLRYAMAKKFAANENAPDGLEYTKNLETPAEPQEPPKGAN